MDKTTISTEIEAEDAVVTPARLNEVLKAVKTELVSVSVAGRERGRGFNPYDGQLGRTKQDLWGRRRRA
jgi:hypothetical protein